MGFDCGHKTYTIMIRSLGNGRLGEMSSGYLLVLVVCLGVQRAWGMRLGFSHVAGGLVVSAISVALAGLWFSI